MTRRLTVAFLMFVVGVGVGVAIRHPSRGETKRERAAAAAVAAASGGRVVQVACSADHCGVTVRRPGARRCDGWIVPLAGPPRRAAFAEC